MLCLLETRGLTPGDHGLMEGSALKVSQLHSMHSPPASSLAPCPGEGLAVGQSFGSCPGERAGPVQSILPKASRGVGLLAGQTNCNWSSGPSGGGLGSPLVPDPKRNRLVQASCLVWGALLWFFFPFEMVIGEGAWLPCPRHPLTYFPTDSGIVFPVFVSARDSFKATWQRDLGSSKW